jgi:peptide/nickel transport system substrate-binding protein
MSFLRTNTLRNLFSSLRPHERVIAWLLFIALCVSSIALLSDLQRRVSTEVPVQGGTYKEGIIGFPRYVNPILANTNPDRNLTQLIYSGLMKRSANGSVVPDLATGMSVSNNQTVYTFNLDPNAEFHDGHPVRAEDVVFTIKSIQNPKINSPKQAQWQNVSVNAVNETTVRFELSESFAGLPANATLGILPKHLWQNESGQSFPFSELNTRPVGSGPYRVTNVERNTDGVPTKFRLDSFTNYVDGQPHIEHIVIESFADSQSRRRAYENGQIDGMPSVDPAYAKQLKRQGERVTTRQFNRVFSVFFNEDQNEALVDESVREALDKSIPKKPIINAAIAGFGDEIDSPLPPSLAITGTSTAISTTTPDDLLTNAGWELTDGKRLQDGEALTISITTADIPSLNKTVNMIADSWRDLGITVNVQTLPAADLTQDIIRPRDYEALLFGQSVSSRRDLYSFWHSSRQEDPGLNLAQYTNSTADGSLEALRSATSSDRIAELTRNFLAEVRQDKPAAFVFSPSFIYVLPDELGNVMLPPITQPADRFAAVSKWYTDTDMLWNIFIDEKDRR